ncbi:MAG: hypothetical protein LUH02_05075 [Erysipelotrichaceae bacterium]|nr:hypothetical protein [Erysipelotrichaceae bacterium]
MGKINDTLMCFAMKYNGNFNDILDAVKNHEDIDYDAMVCYKRKLRYKYTILIKDDYPDFLKDTDGPPIVLFYEGNEELMNKDDAMVYSVNKNKHRFIVSVKPVTFKNERVLDYCVACENQNDLDEILSYLKRWEPGLKNYGQVKKRNEIER